MQKPKNNLAKQQKVFRQTKTTTPSGSLIKITSSIFSILFIVTLLSAFALLNVRVSADDTLPSAATSTTASVYVNTACSLAATDTSHSGTLTPGNFTGGIGTSNFTATCNDPNGYAIYAVGYSNDEWKNTNLIGAGDIGNITTDPDSGHKTSGDTSYWYMKLASGTAATTAGGATIVSPYNDYATIPNDYTKVATASSATDGTTGTSFTSTYGAYIAPAQTPGTYTGKVRYTLVNPSSAPIYMQDLTSTTIAALLPTTHSTATVYDKRDGQAYTVAKLKDGKYWMTENLNIAGGTALSSDDTDFDASYALPTTDGWTTSDGKLILPASNSSGFSTDNYAYVYNTGNKTSNCSTPGCYSYYSWDAATLGSGRSITTDNTDAPYSICPKNWRLPNTRTGTDSTSDFRALMIAYGGTSSAAAYNASTTPTGAAMYSQIGPGIITPGFSLTGNYYGGSFYNGGSSGHYWSATSLNSANVRSLYFNSKDVNFTSRGTRRGGIAIRCIFSS